MLKQELTSRVLRLQDTMRQHSFDSYVVTAEEDIWYFTNIIYKPEERPFFVLVSLDEKPVLLVPKLEEAHLAKGVLDCDIVAYWEYPSPSGTNWYDVLSKLLNNYQRTGVESNTKTETYLGIRARELVATQLVAEQRKVKSPYELDLIRKTAEATDNAMRTVVQSASKGAGIIESFAVSRSIQNKLMCTHEVDITTSLITAVWPAPNSAMPHSIPNIYEDCLGDGPNVAMAYFRINGYAAECERTFFVSRPTEEEEELFHHMMVARTRSLAILKAGVRAADVDYEARNYLVQNGLEHTLLHRTGHGIGLGNHEAPFLADGSEEILQENMVVSIEPGIYIEGVGGYRHSDTTLVTRDGYELMTKYPIELSRLTVM